MFTKEFEVHRKGDWLFLNPKLQENIVALSKVSANKHFIYNSDYFSLDNIIDLRKELKETKFFIQI
jgi:hypothetical protein